MLSMHQKNTEKSFTRTIIFTIAMVLICVSTSAQADDREEHLNSIKRYQESTKPWEVKHPLDPYRDPEEKSLWDEMVEGWIQDWNDWFAKKTKPITKLFERTNKSDDEEPAYKTPLPTQQEANTPIITQPKPLVVLQEGLTDPVAPTPSLQDQIVDLQRVEIPSTSIPLHQFVDPNQPLEDNPIKEEAGENRSDDSEPFVEKRIQFNEDAPENPNFSDSDPVESLDEVKPSTKKTPQERLLDSVRERDIESVPNGVRLPAPNSFVPGSTPSKRYRTSPRSRPIPSSPRYYTPRSNRSVPSRSRVTTGSRNTFKPSPSVSSIGQPPISNSPTTYRRLENNTPETTSRITFNENAPRGGNRPSNFNTRPVSKPKGVLMRLGIDAQSLQKDEVPQNLLNRIRSGA